LQGVHWSDWPGVRDGTIDDENYWADPDFSDPMQATGFTVGSDFYPTYAFRETRYNSLATSFVSQLTKTNQLKSGFEVRRYDIGWDFKQFFNSQPYGELYSSKPLHASFFIEDKLEHHDFIVNVGLRFDYRDNDISYNYTPEDTVAHYRKSETQSRISPRLGVSFPISEKSKFHFNYGVYYQVPLYTYLYTNLDGDRTSGLPILGNPDLKPEQTTSYELGLDHLIGEDFRIDVTAYYKDIDELVSTREIGQVAGQPVTKYVNADYGHVTGFDVALEKLPLNGYLSGSISYGYMIAKGNGSNANEPYYTYLTSTQDTLPPLTEYALDFDQRHTVTAVLDYRVPPDWSYKLFGLKVPGAWGISAVGYYGSGLPYSRIDAGGNRLGERNQYRLPASYSVDMRFNKDFLLGPSKRMLTFFVEVDNLFNRHNVLDVYPRTGLPDDDANRVGSGLSLDAEEVEKYDKLFDHDPENFSPPRTVRTGLEFTF
jgi:outer membrane receptor protein involved in Fe transport